MKKSKLLAVCIIGILMAVGLLLAGCGPACQGCKATVEDAGYDNGLLMWREYKNCTRDRCLKNKGTPKKLGQVVYCDCNKL
jgi:hypothetical protein